MCCPVPETAILLLVASLQHVKPSFDFPSLLFCVFLFHLPLLLHLSVFTMEARLGANGVGVGASGDISLCVSILLSVGAAICPVVTHHRYNVCATCEDFLFFPSCPLL
jgi:hypothetical protein